MKKYLLIPFLIFLLSCSGKKILTKAEYKIIKEEELISCIKPNSIDKINKVFVYDEKGKLGYTIEINGAQGDCTWHRDKLLFKDGSPMDQVNAIVNNFVVKIYFETRFAVTFKVNKIADIKLSSKLIKIPYFVALVQNNNIITKMNDVVEIDLTKPDNILRYGKRNIFKYEFNMQDFKNVEIVSGIYFKNKHK